MTIGAFGRGLVSLRHLEGLLHLRMTLRTELDLGRRQQGCDVGSMGVVAEQTFPGGGGLVHRDSCILGGAVMTVQTDLGAAGRDRLGRIVVTDRTLELRMDRGPKQRLVGAGVRGVTGPAAGLGHGQAEVAL